MSIQLMQKAWEYEGLTTLECMILVILADYATEDGFAWPRQATIAAKAHCSDRSARRTLQALEDYGLIKVVPRPTATAPNAHGYHININLLYGVTDFIDDAVDGEFSASDRKTDTVSPLEMESVQKEAETGTFPHEDAKRPPCPVYAHDEEQSGQDDRFKADTVSGFLYIEPPLEPNTSPLPVTHVDAEDFRAAGEGKAQAHSQAEVHGLAPGGGPPPRPRHVDGLVEVGELAWTPVELSALASKRRRAAWQALSEVAPAWMVEAANDDVATKAAELITQAEASGHSRDSLRRILAADPQPDVVRSPAGLVLSRVRSACERPPARPDTGRGSEPTRPTSQGELDAWKRWIHTQINPEHRRNVPTPTITDPASIRAACDWAEQALADGLIDHVIHHKTQDILERYLTLTPREETQS